VQIDIEQHGIDSASVEDYELKVLVSSDGKHYSTSLTPANGCGVAMFSTDQGVIFAQQHLVASSRLWLISAG
jgi:hypothetical protein